LQFEKQRVWERGHRLGQQLIFLIIKLYFWGVNNYVTSKTIKQFFYITGFKNNIYETNVHVSDVLRDWEKYQCDNNK